MPHRFRTDDDADSSISARVLQCAGRYAYGGYAWTVGAILLLSFGLLAPLSSSKTRARRLARVCARLLFRLAGVPLFAAGLDRLPAQAHVLVVNHTSFLDAILLSALLPAVPGYAFVARRQYMSQGLLWPLLHSVHALILGPPDVHRHANLERLESTLAGGERIVIFPEGGFVPEPGLNPFHSGAFVAAARAGVPVVVAGMRGTRQALTPGRWLPRRVPLSLEVGAVLMPCGDDTQAIHELMEKARAATLSLAGESPGAHRF